MFSSSSNSSRGNILDPLSEVLQDLRIAEATYGHCELTRPWGIEFHSLKLTRFHLVVSGNCWLRVGEGRWDALSAGDVVLVPSGGRHVLTTERGKRAKPLEELRTDEIGRNIYHLKYGGKSGAKVVLVCCSVAFEEPSMHPLLKMMPESMVLHLAASKDAFLTPLLDVMSHEVSSKRVGAATIVTRLADVLITRLIREWIETDKVASVGWLAGIRDPKVGRSLAAIHRTPGKRWSVNSLAKIANSSRSMFSERFTALMGVPVARYLLHWRMHLASLWLQQRQVTVSEAATRLGYNSEAAFSRAFKRVRGVPPSALRTIDRSPQRLAQSEISGTAKFSTRY